MKTYSDLQAIDTRLHLHIELEPVGTPDIAVSVNDVVDDYPGLSDTIILDYHVDLLDLFAVNIELSNKHYTTEYETAVIIKRLSIDNIELIPQYDYLARYINDHDNDNPTSYLGFNGKWTLTIDRPFYHWLHQHSGQGWLIG
jgi:hypothetical protein